MPHFLRENQKGGHEAAAEAGFDLDEEASCVRDRSRQITRRTSPARRRVRLLHARRCHRPPAIDLLPPANLAKLVSGYLDVKQLRPDGPGKKNLLAEVRAFDTASRAGKYYESFNVNSKNFMDKSTGTRAFIADCNRLLERCVAQTSKGDATKLNLAPQPSPSPRRRIQGSAGPSNSSTPSVCRQKPAGRNREISLNRKGILYKPAGNFSLDHRATSRLYLRSRRARSRRRLCSRRWPMPATRPRR